MIQNKHSVFYFEPIQLYSSYFEGEFKGNNVIFEVKTVCDDERGKIKEVTLGSSKISLDPIMSLDQSSLLQLRINDRYGQIVGKLSFGNSKIRPVFTFLDYKINLNINFVPIVAIDYSISNIIVSNQRKSLHDINDNDYVSVINHIRHVYKDISEYCMGYGIGAKTCSSQLAASDIFALSGNMFDPTIEYNQLLEKYEDIGSKVTLSFPYKCSKVLEYASGYAKYESEHHKGRNYYCLIYITPGVIEDIESIIDLLQEVYAYPLTVTIVKLSNPDFSETNDAESLLNQFLEVRKPDQRQPLFVIDYEKFKRENNLKGFELKLISNLPSHAGEYYDSRRSIDFSNKKSTSNHKTFADIIGQNLTLDDREVDEENEEDKEPATESNLVSKRQRIGSENKNNSDKKKRKLSYSSISEELFLATFPVVEDMAKGKLESLVDKGLIFDEDVNYVVHISKDN